VRTLSPTAAKLRKKSAACIAIAITGKTRAQFWRPRAELLILGLAPGAHGANRTGRMFTGDRSGDFLYRGLYDTGFANQPPRETGRTASICATVTSPHRSAARRPEQTQPGGLAHCQPYLERELEILTRVRAVLVLGRIAFDSYLRMFAKREGFPRRSTLVFSHGASFTLPAVFAPGASLQPPRICPACSVPTTPASKTPRPAA